MFTQSHLLYILAILSTLRFINEQHASRMSNQLTQPFLDKYYDAIGGILWS